MERPRERLLRHGVGSLSDAELLALFIRSGVPGENARDLALKLLQNSDGLQGLARRSPTELLSVPGLGPAKVAALVASFEIGKRILASRAEGRPLADSAQAVYQLLRHSLEGEREEVFVGVLLNAKNEMMKTITFSRGDPTGLVVSIPQIIRRLLIEGSAAVIFVHNHPSGDPTPSRRDLRLTERLLVAAEAVDLTVHDHLVIGNGRFFSFSAKGLLGKKASAK